MKALKCLSIQQNVTSFSVKSELYLPTVHKRLDTFIILGYQNALNFSNNLDSFNCNQLVNNQTGREYIGNKTTERPLFSRNV